MNHQKTQKSSDNFRGSRSSKPQNKTTTKSSTMAQLQELLDINDSWTSIIKTFTNRIENLEPKTASIQEEYMPLKGEVKALQEPIEFQNET